MVKRNRVIHTCSIILFLLFFFSLFVPFFKQIKEKAFADEASNSIYAFVSKQSSQATNGKIYVEFGVTLDYTLKNETGEIINKVGEVNRLDAEAMAKSEKYPFESAKIYLRTRNMSAVSELGDYEPIDQTFTVFGYNPIASIAVKVNKSGLQVGDVARQFYVEIYKVEMTGLKDGYTFHQPNETREISSETLSTSAEFSIEKKEFKLYNGEILDRLDLEYKDYIINQNVCQDVTETTSFKSIKIDLGNIGGGWYSKMKYLSDHDMLKLGIRPVLAAYEDPNAWYTDNSFVGLQVFGGNADRVGAPDLEGVPANNIFSDGSAVELARIFAKFQSDEREGLTLEEAFNGEFNGVTVGTRFDENVLIAKALTEKDYQIGSKNYYGAGGLYDAYVGSMDDRMRSDVFLIDDLGKALKGSTTITTRVWKYLSSKVKYYSGSLFLIPTNYRASVESATFGHVYKDEAGNEKIGVSLRFSEPVQFKKYKDGRTIAPYVKGYINGNASNDLTFQYVSGVGTDTLYFEADASKYKMHATRISITSAHGFEDVYDFAPKAATGGVAGENQLLNVMDKIDDKIVNGWDNISTQSHSCSYDFRTPIVDFNQKVPTSAKTSHTITIKLENVGETGKLYYGWTTSKDIVPENISVAQISSSGYQTIYSPANVSGERYLYVYAVSELDKVSTNDRYYGPYYFDNDAPILDIDCADTYVEKTFSITIKNNGVGNIIKYANLKQVNMIVSNDSNGKNVIKTVSLLSTEDKLNSSTLTLRPYTLTAEAIGLKADEFGTFYISFSAVDELGNQSKTPPTAYYFDLRKIFSVSLISSNVEMDEFKTGANGESVLGKNYYTIDWSKKDLADKEGKDFYFTLKADDSAISMDIEQFVRLSKSGENASGKTIYFSRVTMPDGSMKIALQNKFEPGLYYLIVKDLKSTKKSLPIYFYVTNGKVQDGKDAFYQDDTAGYHAVMEKTVFTNEVFQIPTDIFYYHMNEGGEQKKLSYTGGHGPAIFSSWAVALEYIKFCEKLDFYAVVLTSEMAQNLNSTINVTDYRKADGVTQRAETGQVWIRYKDANWRADGTTNDWVYYYYGEDESALPIKESLISEQLKVALETIVETILDKGENIDLVTEEYLDKYGAPNVKFEQMHVEPQNLPTSICGTPFEYGVGYLGDPGMYLSIDVNTNTLLATNAEVPFGDNRRIYYKKETMKEYVLLTKDNRKTFWEYINAEGKFTILELDENGVREYYIYIDKSAPTLTITWQKEELTETGKETVTISQDYSASANGLTVAGSNCYITNIKDYDTLSFVAIYHYTNKGEGDLLYVYRQSDFNGQSISLENGKYYVQVSDRSGNSFIFVLQVKSEELSCVVEENSNSYIQVKTNRVEAEIHRYLVYLNDRLFTTDYNEKRFTEGGKYRFVIEDIYGNIFDETHNFERVWPTVSWSYQTVDGNYAPYVFGEENERINIQEENSQNYVISTSTYLRFTLSDGCTFEILSGNPNPSNNISSKYVTLNNKTPFSMKVFYEADPETYVIYTCIVDDSAPIVSVSYEQIYYQGLELFDVLAKFDNKELTLGNTPFTPAFIGFTSVNDKTTTLYVANGQKVQSKYFKVQVSDEGGLENLKHVKIYCNDTLISTVQEDFNNIYVSRRGSYKILATDKFGNTTTFSFVNDYEERVEYFVDGEKVSSDVVFLNYFEDIEDKIIYQYTNDDQKQIVIHEKVYEKVECGNTQTTIRILSSAEIHYLITDAKGNSYYFAFIVEDGNIYTFQYNVEVVNGEYGLEIENVSVRGVKALLSGEIAKIDEIGVAISLSKNSDGTLSLTVHSTDDKQKSYTVETRVSSLDNSNEMPYYFKTEISTVPSSLQLFVGEDEIENPTSTILVNQSFKFVVNDALEKEIESIHVAFDKTGNFTNYEPYDGLERSAEGMYHVKVVNRFGIQTDYYVIISYGFDMSAIIEYADETTVRYDSTKEHDVFYSNKSVEFIVYTYVEVLDKNEAISVKKTEQGFWSIYINNPGEYLLRVQDEYGNVSEKEIYIKADTLTVGSDVLTGYHHTESGNYTNQKLFVDKKAVLDGDQIAHICMLHGESKIIIYDRLSEEKTPFDQSQYVGVLGNGEYTVIFRDDYGNKAEIVIDYRETSTLKIMRRTLNGVGEEEYSLADALSDGVWTNDLVRFVVSAKEYVLMVDGKENVTSITYDAKTKNEYDVSYEDEYGFKHTFKVYLHREAVEIAPAESMSVSLIYDVPVTKDNVQILFTQGALCSYTLNNETATPYHLGDTLYKDGIYRFKVVDKAGNVATYTVKKDSTVEYRLEGAGANEILVNGGVTNSHSVKFYPENADNAYVKKVFHNNKFIEYSDVTFTERGKWELIVADDAGNESYFRFYILYGKLDGFSYNVPYDYVIDSVMWEMENSTANAAETIKEQGKRLEVVENGKYTVNMKSLVTAEIISFTFTIDKTPPDVQLVGCQPNEKTINDITLKGCSVGDIIYVYRNGKLVKTVRIDSDYIDPPTISEAGKYKIIIENEAGVRTELAFERRYVPNVAGSILVIVLAFASVIGLFVGLIWRNHSKTDD